MKGDVNSCLQIRDKCQQLTEEVGLSVDEKACLDFDIMTSKQSMCKAIFKLLESQSFTKITVSSICKVAHVSRTTFYAYFQDKYDLIRFALDQENKALEEASEGSIEKEIHALVTFVFNNRKVLKHLNEQNDELFHILKQFSITSLKKHVEQTNSIPGNLPVAIPAVFLAGGRAWLLLWWINNDCETPKDLIEAYLVKMLKG